MYRIASSGVVDNEKGMDYFHEHHYSVFVSNPSICRRHDCRCQFGAAELHNLGFLHLFVFSPLCLRTLSSSHLSLVCRDILVSMICENVLFFLCCFCSACYSIYFALDTFFGVSETIEPQQLLHGNINTDRHTFIVFFFSHPVVGWCAALNSAQQCVGTLNA